MVASELDKAEFGNVGAFGAAAQQAIIKGWIAAFLWRFFDEHRDDELLTVKVLFIRKTIRVRDLQSLFTRLVGPHP